MTQKTIVISANCRNETALGDYQIAAQIASSFISTLTHEEFASQNITIVLMTTEDRIRAFTNLFGSRDNQDSILIGENRIKLYSDSKFPLHDYTVIAYISANHCRTMPTQTLKNILTAQTKISYVCGPHHENYAQNPLAYLHFTHSRALELGTLYNYFEPYIGSLGFAADAGRLGFHSITPAAQQPELSEAESSQLPKLPYNGYAFAYFNGITRCVENELEEFIALSHPSTNNFLFIGNYAAPLKQKIKSLPYSIDYQIDENQGSTMRVGPYLNINHTTHLPYKIFKQAALNAQTLVGGSGVNFMQEALVDGKIIYLQHMQINSVFVNSYLSSLQSLMCSITKSPQEKQTLQSSHALASILMKPKPLTITDKQQAAKLLKDTAVTDNLVNNNQALMQSSQKSIAKQLLPFLLQPNSDEYKNKQLKLAMTALRKPTETELPNYEQALRRAAFYNKRFELKVLLEHMKTKGFNINGVTPPHNMTPLHFAAQAGHINIVIELLYQGANPNLIDAKGRTAAYLASQGQHTKCLDKLIEKNTNNNNLNIINQPTVEENYKQYTNPSLKRSINTAFETETTQDTSDPKKSHIPSCTR